MDRKQLAEEIRGAGRAIRYLDSPVLEWRPGKRPKAMHTPQEKLKTSDLDIIRMASTCHTCDAYASDFDIEFVESMADDYQGFARLIWPSVKHQPWCPAEPYISISEEAAEILAKAREKYEARLIAKEAQKAAKLLRGPKATPEKKKQQEKEAEKAAKKIANLEAELEAARKALQKQNRRVTKKAVRKKVTKAKKKPTKKKKA
jgi:hypothetical protein